MRRKCKLLVAGATLAFLGGCGGFDMNPVLPVDFADFVKSQIAQTSDATDPVSIDGLEFEFNEDSAAFDDVLATMAEAR
ncbi:MAG: hypothetical protein HRF50_18090 [Phycisphaerae bacterium]|jgi:hypothetical protein